MRRELIVPRVLILVVTLFGLVPSTAAQRTTATFAGIVSDTSGGVLPGTDVELSNEGTGIVERQVTSEALRLNGLGGAAMSITANGTDASANAGARQISQYNGISKIDIVSIESVGEVQIVKGISPAEFGHALAGNLNIVTKAGTNNYHGSVFHRYEGAALVSKPFFLKEKPDSKWNQGGGSLGGPLMASSSWRPNRTGCRERSSSTSTCRPRVFGTC
jgi:outer membrane receptor protein involved in Fe transport